MPLRGRHPYRSNVENNKLKAGLKKVNSSFMLIDLISPTLWKVLPKAKVISVTYPLTAMFLVHLAPAVNETKCEQFSVKTLGM